MTLVLKVNCRACNRECGDYKHLLDETVIDDESTTLAALLSYCTTLECFVEGDYDNMPEHICNSCVEHLLQSYLFKEMVLQTDRETRERLKLDAEVALHTESAHEVEEPAYVDQDVDVGGVDEENLKSFIAKEEDNVTVNEMKAEKVTEYEMEEWLEIDDDTVAATTPATHPESEEGADHSIKESFVKIEDGTEIDENEFIIMEETYNSDTMDDLEGFEKENEKNEEGTEEGNEDTAMTEKEEPSKTVRKKFVKVRHFLCLEGVINLLYTSSPEMQKGLS